MRLRIAFVYLVFLGVIQADPLHDLIHRADVVAMGTVTHGSSGPDGTYFGLAINQILKGSLTEGTIAVSFTATGPKVSLTVNSVCGIFFLKRQRSQWVVIPQATPQLTFDSLFMPTNQCSAAMTEEDRKAPAMTRVIRALLRGVETSGSQPRYIYRLFSMARPRESAEIAAESATLSQSSVTNLRLLGLAWRTAENDSSALKPLASEVPALGKGSALEVMLVTAIATYSNAETSGVSSLGAIAAATPGGFLEQAASEALRNIHSRESLPYALKLLDSGNARVRENAVAIFSMFVLDVPPLNDQNRARVLEQSMNPATRKRLDPGEEAHVHFGPMPGDGTAAELIQWWKSWYARSYAAQQ